MPIERFKGRPGHDCRITHEIITNKQKTLSFKKPVWWSWEVFHVTEALNAFEYSLLQRISVKRTVDSISCKETIIFGLKMSGLEHGTYNNTLSWKKSSQGILVLLGLLRVVHGGRSCLFLWRCPILRHVTIYWGTGACWACRRESFK